MNNDGYGQHISQQFNADLEEVRTKFLSMGGIVEKQVFDALQALLETDGGLASEVWQKDHEVNRLETAIDEGLVRILARRQPAASDLRMVIGISKANTDLERVGDEAAKIARIAQLCLKKGSRREAMFESRHIGNQVVTMVHDALDAFARLDADQALLVMQKDAEIDREYQTATRALMTYMMEDPRYLGRVINVLWVLRSLERIGDHARNISEQVIYMVKGADVRHKSYEHVEAQIKRE